MIPAELRAPGADRVLLEYLIAEFRTIRSERAQLEQDWSRWQEVYRARSPQGDVTFPFPGASKVTIPVAATDIDIFVAQMLGILWSTPNLWAVPARKAQMVTLAPKLEEWLTWAQGPGELNMYPTVTDWVTGVAKLGTGLLKQRYAREKKLVYEWREMPGGQIYENHVERTVLDRPDVSMVQLADFWVSPNFNDLQRAPCTFERVPLSWGQLEARANAGIYGDISKLAFWHKSLQGQQRNVYQNAQQQLDHFLPSRGETFDIIEAWCDFDIDGRGRRPIVATFHELSNALLRVDYNPTFGQERPYSVARFIRNEGRFYGIGLCEIYESAQDEITAMHRQRLDSGTIRNSQVYKGRKGVVKSGTEIFPGAVLVMENPAEDLIPMNMGLGAGDTIGAESFLLQYMKQRTGVSDYMAGGAGSNGIPYSAATTAVEMLKQGKLKVDQVMREIRDALSETGRRVLEYYAQFDQGQKIAAVLGDEDALIVQGILALPLDMLRAGVGVEIAATSAHLNKETQLRTQQLIYEMVLQFYTQLFQAMQIAVNPQVPPELRAAAAQMMHGGTILMRRILETYNEQEVDQIIPDLRGLVTSGNAQLSALQGAIGGGAPMGAFPGAPPGVPAIGPGPAGAVPTGPFGAPQTQLAA